MRKLVFFHDGTVEVHHEVSNRLEELFTQADSGDWSAINTLCTIKQDLIDKEDYEALIPFRDLENQYEFGVPFIVRRD